MSDHTNSRIKQDEESAKDMKMNADVRDRKKNPCKEEIKLQEGEDINDLIIKPDCLKTVKDNYKHLLILSLEFGFLFMLCFYDFYKNLNGIVYPIFVLGLFGFACVTLKVLKKSIKKNTYNYIIAAALLGISSFLTMNWFIVWINTLGIIILFTMFLLKQFYEDDEWGIIQYVGNIMLVWLDAIPGMRYIIIHGIFQLNPSKYKDKKWIPALKGIIYGFIFLSIVVPLLASADMIFQEFLERIFTVFRNPFSGEWNYYIFLVVIAMLLFYGLVCSFVSGGLKQKNKVVKKKEPTSALVMTGVIAVTYLIFCGIQIVFLFGGNFLTLPNGITYANYAHQGFFQLLFVVIINIGMVILCVKKVTEHSGLKKLLTIISICTFIMIASAMYRMILYISVYHLTFLRVLVIWFLITLTILMSGVVYFIYHNIFKINKYIFRTVLICYLVLAFIRPDYIIASYNISQMKTIDSEDACYLLSNLSYDAAPALAKIDASKFGIGENANVDFDNSEIKSYIDAYFKNIIVTYENKIRSFNVSKYVAYRNARNYRDIN